MSSQRNNILQANDRLITLLFWTRGEDAHKDQIKLRCTFIQIWFLGRDSLTSGSWLSDSRQAGLLPGLSLRGPLPALCCCERVLKMRKDVPSFPEAALWFNSTGDPEHLGHGRGKEVGHQLKVCSFLPGRNSRIFLTNSRCSQPLASPWALIDNPQQDPSAAVLIKKIPSQKHLES